ncbi:MAG TPA: c-type cytochrome, partial [Candidatus Limnocylindrales bacterium]
DTVKLQNSSLPIDQGFPAYYSEARAFVILYDPGQQRFLAGEDTAGDGQALNVRALYQRCPHLGCKPNPCLKNFWFECPCHGSRYDRLGIKADGAQYGPAPRSMDRFSIDVDDAGVLTINTGKITLGPLPHRARPAGFDPAPHADRLHLMSDTSGREPEEERLPVPRPPAEPAPVERFTSPPSVRAVELSPERAAQVVRQSSNARWVGFLGVVVVALFIAVYWFYELAPIGFTQSRLDSETAAQQVTSVERGYDLYQANCARCHGPNGEGGIGPTLNRQDKLFAHLSVDYLNNMMLVGGRYACGNPLSLMPVWSNAGHPPGPLNYVQIEDLIAFIRAPDTATYTIRDPALNEPKIDPITGKVETFQGLGRSDLQARSRRHAVPGLLGG